MRKNRIVIDTNLFVYRFLDNSEDCINLLKLIKYQVLKPVFSQTTIGELIYLLRDVLIGTLTMKEIEEILVEVMRLIHSGIVVNTKFIKSPELKDKDDEEFVKCAIKTNAKYLVSNDTASGIHEVKYKDLEVLYVEDIIDIFKDEIIKIDDLEQKNKAFINA